MSKIDLLKNLNRAINKESSFDFSEFDESVSQLKDNLKREINIVTLEDVKTELSKFKKRIDLQPVVEAVGNLSREFEEKNHQLSEYVSYWMNEITRLLETSEKTGNEKSETLVNEIEALKEEMSSLLDKKSTEIHSLRTELVKKLSAVEQLDAKLGNLSNELSADRETVVKDKKVVLSQLSSLSTNLEQTRRELTNRINNIPRGGGNANRQINVSSSVMSSKYTDINFRAGSNITLAKADDDDNKRVNITITGTGGGSGFTLLPATGDVNSVNAAFTFTEQPDYIISDGVWYRVDKGWTWSGSTATMNIPPNDDLFGFVS